jgi:hypothetical protein
VELSIPKLTGLPYARGRIDPIKHPRVFDAGLKIESRCCQVTGQTAIVNPML